MEAFFEVSELDTMLDNSKLYNHFYKIIIKFKKIILGATIESLLQQLNKPPHKVYQIWDEIVTFFASFGLYKKGDLILN